MRRLTSVHAFKGCKMDVSKVLTPNFVLRHSVQLGDSPANPQANEHYSFMAQVYNDNGVMMSTLDQYGAWRFSLLKSCKRQLPTPSRPRALDDAASLLPSRFPPIRAAALTNQCIMRSPAAGHLWRSFFSHATHAACYVLRVHPPPSLSLFPRRQARWRRS